MHHDVPFQFNSIAQAQGAMLSAEDSFLAGAITSFDIRPWQESEDFSSEALALLGSHSVFKSAQRVCIARRLGMSNQIRVVSSATGTKYTNTMSAGYSCFVSKGSSLFSIGRGTLRSYRDAATVVKSFIDQNRPPQRSIFRIAANDFAGGLCMGLFLGEQQVGFFFLNFDRPVLDALRASDYMLLSMLSRTAFNYLARRGLVSTSYTELAKNAEADYVGCALSPELLKTCIETSLKKLRQPAISLEVSGYAASTLISHGNLAQIIARYLEVLSPIQGTCRVFVALEGKHLMFRVKLGPSHKAAMDDYRVPIIQADAKALGLNLVLGDGVMLVQADFDGESSWDYSVDHETNSPHYKT